MLMDSVILQYNEPASENFQETVSKDDRARPANQLSCRFQ